MLEQFERLLASAVSAPEQHISKLELLSSAERRQLLVERNDTHVAYPHSRGIHELFEEQVAIAPEAPALTLQGEHLSYAELKQPRPINWPTTYDNWESRLTHQSAFCLHRFRRDGRCTTWRS